MNIAEAQSIVSEVLHPLRLEDFLAVLGRRALVLPRATGAARTALFGDDPVATALSGYATQAATLDCHAVAPSGPVPAPRPIEDAAGFAALVQDYHDADYTVRFPDVTGLSPALARFVRALSMVLRQPVEASLFWSKPGAGAIVHFDRRDNLVVQLRGRKRWFVSTDEPALSNVWSNVDETPAGLARHQEIDLEPGDMLYLPRGLPHTVAGSDGDSLHLAILFVPETVRDALIAAIDWLADRDRSLRETLEGNDNAIGRVAQAAQRLAAVCHDAGAVRDARDFRWARMVGDLPAMDRREAAADPTPDSQVCHAPRAILHVHAGGQRLDLAVPGTHIGIHPGAEGELRFIAETSRFRIGDIPGATQPEVKIALVKRLMAEGVLVLSDGDHDRSALDESGTPN